MGIIRNLDLTEKINREIPAACIKRILDRQPITDDPYPMRTLYPSMIHELTAKEFVLGYYVPDVSVDSWTKKMYTSHGQAAERIIQEGLYRAGVLTCPHERFKEPKVYCPTLGISGRADGVAYKELLKHWGAVECPTEDYQGGDLTPIILELKETSYYGYSRVEGPMDIPVKFQWAQAAYQMLLEIPETMFIYINRDSMDLKTIMFRSTKEMQQEVSDKCMLLWNAVRNQCWDEEDGSVTKLEDFLKERVC